MSNLGHHHDHDHAACRRIVEESAARDHARRLEAIEAEAVSTYVSIGRLEGRGPLNLSDGRWLLFKADVFNALRRAGVDIVSSTEGTGRYMGAFETSAVIVAAGRPRDVDGLRRELAGLARSYDQEAIALTVAPVEFIGPAGAGLGGS